MEELLRTNDMALISFVEALLWDAEIPYQVLDSHMSVVEGTLGILPRRIVVMKESMMQAHRLLVVAGLSDEAREFDDGNDG
ncbi:MAG: DUF2007 domain-containing protein [Parvularculales bacterium]